MFMKAWFLGLLICCCLLGCKEAQPAAVTTNPEGMEGKTITIRGKALNGKAGAMAGEYYVDGLSNWPDDAYGRMVEVTGKLKVVEHKEESLRNENGEWSQGMVGKQQVLMEPKWKVVRE
jgi:hypothetical protein